MNQQEFERAVFDIIERKVAHSALDNSNARAYTALLMRSVDDARVSNDDDAGKAADFAFRQHEALQRECGVTPHGGFWMPMVSGRNARDLDATSGAPLIPAQVAKELIPSLVPNSAVVTSGARIISVNRAGTFALPRVATGATVSVTADGSAAAGGDPSNDQCVLVPFTISATIKISRRFSIQNTFGAMLESAISGDLQRRVWAELDRLILAGTGTGEPLGIIGNSAVATYAAGIDGAAPTPAMLNAMEKELGSAYSGGALTWFINAAMRKTVRELPTGAGLSPLWSDDNALQGYSTVVTEHIPSDLTKGTGTSLSASILGDFSQVLIGLWKPAYEVVINPYASNGSISITVFMDAGFGLMRNEAFIVASDFVTA